MYQHIMDRDELQQYKNTPGVYLIYGWFKILVDQKKCPPDALKELKALKKKFDKENQEFAVEYNKMNTDGRAADYFYLIEFKPPLEEKSFAPG